MGETKLNPHQIPQLVMRSVENARTAIDDGNFEKAIKMMTSTDQLCSKVVAPPTIHGLALRVLADAFLGKGGAVEEAKQALQKGLALCKQHDGKAGMPPFMVADLNGRMGDLHAGLGELFREEANYKDALRHLRNAVDRFERLDGASDFVPATLNRVAFTLICVGSFKDALSELEQAERLGLGGEREAELLSSTYRHQGVCWQELGDTAAAREAWTKALNSAASCGNETVLQEAQAYLEKTQDQSSIDQDAFL